MPYTVKRARGSGSGKKDRVILHMRKQGGIRSSDQTGKPTVATLSGLAVGIVLVLGLALMFMIGHSNIVNASGSGLASGVPVGYGSLNHSKGPCGNSGQAACAPADPGWFAVTSESPNNIAAAIAGSKNFASMRDRFEYVSLDTPVLVHAYGAHTGIDYYDDDHWVVSVLNASGMRVGIFDFVYDRAHQRMRFSSYGVVTPLDPHSRHAFPYISLSTAVAHLQSQRGLSVMIGAQPELIFFPIDPSFPDLSSPIHKWAGGGNSAMNPMWYIVGSDGRDYFVGTDLHVHTGQELPIAKGQP